MEKQADITPCKVASSFKNEVLECSTQAENISKQEDPDTFNPIEPPPLDWRSDSSSEVCSLKDVEETGSLSMDTSLEGLSDCGTHNTSFTPRDVGNLTSQEAKELPNQEGEDLINQNAEDCTNNTDRINKCKVPEPLEKNLEKTKHCQQHDIDHSHIQDLLNQLQLFHPMPPSKDSTPEPEAEKPAFNDNHATKNLSSSCLLPDVSAYQTCSLESAASGLLFTMSHQRELLKLLEVPEPQEPQEFQESQKDHPTYTEQTEISQLPDYQTRYLTRSGEADEMVAVSYDSDIWHSPFPDELMMSSYLEEELMEESKCVISDELASCGADVVSGSLFIVQ